MAERLLTDAEVDGLMKAAATDAEIDEALKISAARMAADLILLNDEVQPRAAELLVLLARIDECMEALDARAGLLRTPQAAKLKARMAEIRAGLRPA